MASIFYDRTNDAGSGTRYDRSNDATVGVGNAFGDIGTAVASAISATVIGYATVTLTSPLYSGPGSITYTSNFTGVPAVGDIVRYPTTNNFQVLPDSAVVADVNSGAYACFYTALDGSFTDEPFTVNLSGTANAFGDINIATTVAISATAVGFTAGAASGLIGTATTVAPDATAIEAAIASGDIGTATTSAPTATAASSAFPGDAVGGIAIATAFAVEGSATGMAIAFGAIGTAAAIAMDGTANEAGRGDAIGDLPVAFAFPVLGTGRAQWGHVSKADTIWTVVPKHG